MRRVGSKSPSKILARRGKNGQLIVNSHNAHTDQGVGPDSPGISSLEYGTKVAMGYNHHKEESVSDDNY